MNNWLAGWLEGRQGRLAEVTLELGPKLLAVGLLVCSVVRLLSSTFRSFLYFQF